MKEEITAGHKEFFMSVLWAAFLYVFAAVIAAAFRGQYKFIGGIIGVLIFCVFGFFILTHYTARFTYSIKNSRLRINRMIGKRNKEIELDCRNIIDMSYGYKPTNFPKRPYNMRISVFGRKKSMYISYTDKRGEAVGVIIEPSDKLRRRIEKMRTAKQDED